jgi:hypothetical protein
MCPQGLRIRKGVCTRKIMSRKTHLNSETQIPDSSPIPRKTLGIKQDLYYKG